MTVASTASTATAPRWQIWTALSAVYVIWGSTYLGIAYVVDTMPALTAMGARFVVAGFLVLIALAVLRGRSALRATGSELATAAMAGLLLLLGGNGLVAIAERSVASGLAALLVACTPLWVVVLRAMFGDRPAAATIGGVVLGLVGTAVLLLPSGGGHTDPGHAVIVVLASMSWAIGTFVSTKRPVPRDPFLLTAVEMLAGGAAMLVLGAALGDWTGFELGTVSGSSWLAMGYLILFGSMVAFTAFVWLLQNAPVSQVTTHAYVNPAVAVALGALMRHEPITSTVLVGGAIILGAVVLVVSVESRGRLPDVDSRARGEPSAPDVPV